MSIENFNMPVGRIVSGNPTSWEDAVDYHTKQKKLNDEGTPRKENRVSIAYNKQEFLDKVWPYILQEVGKVYPQYGNMHPDQCEMSRFAWKVINGDSPNCPQGSQVPYNTREGYPGCYIVKISTSAFLPGTFKFENGAYRKVEPNEVKCGDYIVANLTITAHNEKDGGLYWNPNGYELVGYGTEIKGSGGANPMAMFGGATHQLPAGASLTPISSAPTTAQMPMAQPTNFQNTVSAPAVGVTQVNGMVNAGTAVPQMSNGGVNTVTQASMPMAQPAPMPAPAYDFVNNAQGIQPAPAAMPAQMPMAQPGFTQPVASAAAPMGMPQAAPAPMAQPVQSAPQQGQPFNSLIQDRIPY